MKAKPTKPLPVYLDELERETLETLASGWGVSMSAALKRLIRERREAMNQL